MSARTFDRIDDTGLKTQLPEYLARLGCVPTRTNERESWYCCPLHQEHTASFHLTRKADGDVFKCLGCGAGGTVLDLHAQLQGMDARRDYRAIVEAVASILGSPLSVTSEPIRRPAPKIMKPEPEPSRVELPKDASPGTLRDWQELATRRRISPQACETASRLGTLYFATVCGSRCWLLTDESRRLAEARRMDGQLFPPVMDEGKEVLGERKSHTLRGSKKGWLVGLHVKGFESVQYGTCSLHARDFRAFLAVEGGPDYLAALHFILCCSPLYWPGTIAERQGCGDCLPLAFMGASTDPLLTAEDRGCVAGKRVRLYQHDDSAGQTAVVKWARALVDAKAEVDAFTFQGLRRRDGSPVGDLNDCTDIRAEDAPKLFHLLP